MFAILLTDSMDPFYQNISSFPTVIFTFFLAIFVLYWIVAILGLVDMDILDFDIPGGDESLNANHHIDNASVLAGVMLKLGLHGVPVTIILSIISLIGWIICYYAAHYILALVPGGFFRYLLGLPILAGALYVSALLTAVLIRPLRPLFKNATQEVSRRILGQTVIVRTSRVDNNFGEAVFSDGGAGLILKVRAMGDQVFHNGDRVTLLEYNKNENTYSVISEQEFIKN